MCPMYIYYLFMCFLLSEPATVESSEEKKEPESEGGENKTEETTKAEDTPQTVAEE